MKRSIGIVLVILLAVSLAACTPAETQESASPAAAPESAAPAAEEQEAEPAKPDGDIVIGATGLQLDQFTQVLFQGYTDAGEELGITVMTANSENSLEKEAEMVNNFIEAGAQAIIIEPVSPDSSAAMAELAAEKGIPVFACAIGINSDKVFASSINDCYDLGQSTGGAAVPFLEETFGREKEIKAAILAFDTQDPTGSEGRITGFQDAVADFNINYVTRQEGFMPEDAYTVATDILTANPDIELFYCANEGGVVGAVNAIKAAGKAGQVYVMGVDCSVQICDMLLAEDNILQAVTAQDPYQQGVYSVKTMYDYVVNGTEPAEKDLKVDGILVQRSDPDGVKQFAEEWAARAGG